MFLRRIISGVLAVLLVGLAYPVVAEQDGGSGLLPVIPEGRGDACVEETGFMRRNHMELLKHQRDETMLKGVRSKQHSLKECLDCHAVYGPDAVAVTAASPEHFCRSCHDYAAVNIDCFQCHASRPEPGKLPDNHRMSGKFQGTTSVNGHE
jgi:predicted CXXCH cytochrome family protein